MKTDNYTEFIKQYTSEDTPLLQLLRLHQHENNVVLHALLYIEECLSGTRLAKDAIRYARAVPLAESNPEIIILLLSRWAELYCRIGQHKEASSLLQHANTLLSENTHEEISAALQYAESILSGTRGNRTEQEKKLIHLLDELSEKSPRKKFYLFEYSFFAAKQGRLLAAKEQFELLKNLTSPALPEEKILLVKILNSFETGQTTEIREALTTINDPVRLLRQLGPQYDGIIRPITSLMESSLRPENEWFELKPPSEPEHHSVKIIRYLLSRKTEEALDTARLTAGRSRSELIEIGFPSFNLIRAELSQGNAEAAQRLIELRQSYGNVHYLDNFFLARVEVKLGNMKNAAALFALCLNECEKYNAKKRLDFELALSCELSRSDIIKIAQPSSEIKTEDLTAAKKYGPPRIGKKESLTRIIGESKALKTIKEMILRFADLDAPVLITGETGTGKELVARALHENSKRTNEPFIAVNCGSIAEMLLESELFGHEKGAFTGADRANTGLFQEAGAGSIFLDEMGEIMPRLQRALLRVLETGEIRPVGSPKSKQIKCRIIAATNLDLNRAAEEGNFRKDLLFRLQRLGIYIPPLRERKEDILPLAYYFLNIDRKHGTRATLSNDLEKMLELYDWPGNVRELRNVIERMRLMHSDKLNYSIDDIDLKFQTGSSAIASPQSSDHRKINGRSISRIALPSDDEVFFREGRSQIRRLDRIHELFKRYTKLTRSEIVDSLGISPNTATKDLQTLVKLGVIRRVEPSASSRSFYFILNEKKARNKTE